MTAEKNEKGADLDDVLSKFSLFGRYYGTHMVYFFLAYITNSIYCSNYIFAAEEVGYRCKDETYGNASCSGSNSTSKCTEWVYDNPDSFVAEFDLACQEWKRTLVGTAHSFGYMVGLLMVGPVSDRIGRKKTMVITGITGGVLGLTKSVTTSYWLYILLEFLEAAFGDICSPSYILNLEMSPTNKRVLYSVLPCFGYPVGGLLMALAAWQFAYWRTYLRVIYAPALFFFTYAYLIDESPRWLLSTGKKEKAIKFIETIAKKSDVKVEKSVLEKLSYEATKDIDLLNLLKTTFASRQLLKRFLVCIIWWITCTFVNYGLTINSVSLEGNKYVNFALISLVDIPGSFIVYFMLTFLKRKLPLMACFLLGGALCIGQPFVPSYSTWLPVLVYLLGKMVGSLYFNITYIYTSELFPTYTRNSMHALCSSIGRIGSIIAPQTPLLMVYWSGLPSMIFGVTAFVAGLITVLVPETGGDCLPDTISEAEAVGQKKTVEEKCISKL